MKKLLLVLSVIISTLLIGCNKSSDKPDTPDKVVEKLIKSLVIKHPTEGSVAVDINYDNNNKITTITAPPFLKAELKYDGSGKLDEIIAVDKHKDEKTIKISELLDKHKKEIKFFEENIYKVLNSIKYDSKKNITEVNINQGIFGDLIKFTIEGEIDNETDNETDNEYISKLKITYNENPFFLFQTLKATGLVDILENININFAAPDKPKDTKSIKDIIPFNNIDKIEIYDNRNKEGELKKDSELKLTYTYDSDNYPTTIIAEILDEDENEKGEKDPPVIITIDVHYK